MNWQSYLKQALFIVLVVYVYNSVVVPQFPKLPIA